MTSRHTYVVRGTHRPLVSSVPARSTAIATHASADRGMVVVPLSRGEPQLETPARIALDLGWPLLLLCSHGNRAPLVRALVSGLWPGLPVVAVDLPSPPPPDHRKDDRWKTVQH